MSAAIREVIGDAARWKNVQLEIDTQSRGDLLLLQAATVPILETLKISFNPRADRLRGYSRAGETVDLFGGRAERLRVLDLNGIALPWDSPLMTQVNDLTLAGAVISPIQLHDLLRSNLNLKRLDIRNLLPPRTPENDAHWSPTSPIEHEMLERFIFGWTHGGPATVVLQKLITPNCTSFTVELGEQPRNGSLSPSSSQALEYTIRHISAASLDEVKIVLAIRGDPAAYHHFSVQGTSRLPNAYDLHLTLPASYQGARRWIGTILERLHPVARNVVLGVEFDWGPHRGHVQGSGPLMRFLGRMPRLKTMVNRDSIDGRLLKLMSRPEAESRGWLFGELEEFVVQDVSSRGVLLDLLKTVKRRYRAITSDSDFGDAYDSGGDSDFDNDSDTDNNNVDPTDSPDIGDTDMDNRVRRSNTTAVSPPPVWKKLELQGVASGHAKICARIREAANIPLDDW